MNSKNLSELSVSELTEKEKKIKVGTGFLGGILIISSILIIGLFIQKLYGTVCFVLIFCFFRPIYQLSVGKKQMSAIKIEIEKRNNNQ
jgi:hypothetical protein